MGRQPTIADLLEYVTIVKYWVKNTSWGGIFKPRRGMSNAAAECEKSHLLELEQ